MNEKRKELRYENSALPYDLCNIFMIFPDGVEIIAKLNNICSCGMRLTLPTDEFYNPEISWLGVDLVINFPLKNIRAKAECINIEKNSNHTITFGVYFQDLEQQNMFNDLLISSLYVRMPA